MTVSVPAMLQVDEHDGIVQVCATLLTTAVIERNFAIRLTTDDDKGKLVIIDNNNRLK